MARTDRSRIEVFPVEGGFALRRFDKYGRRAWAPEKVFTRRNNTLRLRRDKQLGDIPIISVDVVRA
jgi:hypothetical protein